MAELEHRVLQLEVAAPSNIAATGPVTVNYSIEGPRVPVPFPSGGESSSTRSEPRGESGRDRLRIQSRIYLVFKDFHGQVYDPVKVCHSFSEAKPLVKPDGYLGDSILIVWPTPREAKLCTREAGIRWPA